MRVLMTTWGWSSHFYCLAPLGWALQAAGHEVRVASKPAMAAVVTSAGLPVVPVGEDLEFAEVFAGQVGRVGSLHPDVERPAPDAAGPGPGPPRIARRAPRTVEPEISADGGTVRFADAMLDDLVAFGRHFRPDLVVYEPFNLAGPVAAAALGVPGVLHLWGPDSSGTLRLDRERVIGPIAARFGLCAGQVRLPGALTLDPAPAPLQVPLGGPSQPVRFVPFNGIAVLPDWLWEPPTRPRVCLAAGNMMATLGLADGLGLPRVLAAVAQLDVEVVVVVHAAQRQRLGELPANVRLLRSPLALHLLLPTCAALVQHGGALTTMNGVACGVPQLVLPQVTDQHFNARRLAVTGAGTWLEPEHATVAEIRDRVASLLDDERWQRSATRMRGRVERLPSPADVVPVLCRLAETRDGGVQTRYEGASR